MNVEYVAFRFLFETRATLRLASTMIQKVKGAGVPRRELPAMHGHTHIRQPNMCSGVLAYYHPVEAQAHCGAFDEGSRRRLHA